MTKTLTSLIALDKAPDKKLTLAEFRHASTVAVSRRSQFVEKLIKDRLVAWKAGEDITIELTFAGMRYLRSHRATEVA